MSYAERVKRDGPAGFWLLDETSGTTATNEVGSNGVYLGDYQLGVTALQGTGNSVRFNGTNADGRVDTGFRGTGGAFSFECWVEPDSDLDTERLFSNDTSSSEKMMQCQIYQSRPGVFINDGSTTSGARPSSSTVSSGTVYHLVFTFDGETFIVYQDGEEIARASDSTIGTWDHSDDNITIANSPSMNGWEYNGVMDNASYYEYALTPQQIRRHYWSGQGYEGYALEVLVSRPSGYWLMDTSSGDQPDEVGTRSMKLSSGVQYEQPSLVKTGFSSIDFPDTEIGQIANGGDLAGTAGSFEFWIKPPWKSDDGNQYYLTQIAIDSDNRFTIQKVSSNDMVAGWQINDNIYRFIIPNSVYGWSADTVHHLVFVWDAAAPKIAFYIDGELVGSDTSLEPIPDMSGMDWYLSRSDPNYDLADPKHSECTFDEVAIYERVLTSQEVRRHYELGLAENSYRIETVSSLPKYYWKLDESSGASTAIDEMGNQNFGYETSQTRGEPPLITKGKSVKFSHDGAVSTENVTIATGSHSFEMWFNFTVTPAEEFYYLLTDRGSSNISYIIRVDGKSGTVVQYYLLDSNGSVNVSYTFNTNTVYHLVASWDGATMRMYIDGELVDSASQSSKVSSGDTLGIGGHVSDTTEGFEGFLDEIAYYERALTEAEIVRHYYVGKFGPVLGTILFIEGVVTDESDGSALDATVRAYRWSDGKLLQSTTSDSSTGEYRIEGVEDSDLLVVMQPLNNDYRPLAHGPLKPAQE